MIDDTPRGPGAASSNVVIAAIRATGPARSRDTVISVAAQRLIEGEKSHTARLVTWVRPDASVRPRHLRALGASARQMRRAPRIDALLPRLVPWLNGADVVVLDREDGAQLVCELADAAGLELAPRAVWALWPSLADAGHVTGERASLTKVARALGTPSATRGDLERELDALVAAWQRMTELDVAPKPPRGRALPLTGTAIDASRLAALPCAPGVYRFVDERQRVLYVGKARDLRARVTSYFRPRRTRRLAHRELAARIHDVQVSTTSSELRALLLEQREIARWRPPFNVQRERSEYDRTRGRWIVFLEGPTPSTVQLLLVRDGLFVGDAVASRTSPNPTELRSMLVRAFFTDWRASAGPIGSTDADARIVLDWIDAHRMRQSRLDVDLAAGVDDALRLLLDYLDDPDLLDERVVHR